MTNSNIKLIGLLCCSIFAMEIASVMAAELPNLKQQKAWGNDDKKAFIQYLESGKQVPMNGNGNVKSVEPEAEEAMNFNFAKAKYINFSLLTNSFYTVGSDDVRHPVSSNIGAKVLIGGHIFSWVRYYFGMQYSGMDQKMKTGQEVRLNHYEFPVGFELALIPLGTPQTRYVLLRGGASAHYIQANRRASDFATPMLGLRGSWNLGLGYEWQLPDTNWRVNLLVEGFKSISKEDGSRFTGAGLTTGVVYTF